MRTSAKHPCRLIAAALAALQLCAGAAGAVFDNSFSYTYSLGSGLQYSRTEGKNSAGLQRANVLTYSPNTGVTPIMVYADEQLYGSKATITNAVKYLQNQGKTVLGGTNADFFVMSTGIPIGLVIAARGGTRIEPWISPDGVERAGLKKELQLLRQFDWPPRKQEEYEKETFARFRRDLKAWLPSFRRNGRSKRHPQE